MADSFKLTDGTTTYELQYDSATQTDYRLKYNSRIQVAEPDVLVHVPDDGESLPVRAVDRDRQVFLTVHFPSGDDTWDDVLNNVTKIKRMVDGAHSQALRYWLQGDVDRVVLRVQKDGATNYTDLPVKWGFVDDSNAYYTEVQEKWGWQIVIMLTVGPYGEGASISLRNDLPSSPHFVEDSDSDGLADGWSVATGTPVTSLDTTIYLAGGQSQQVDVDASTAEGVRSDIVASTAAEDVVAYIWIHATAGDRIQIFLADGSFVFVTGVYFDPASPAGYDKTATGASGETWYRYSLTSTSTRSNANIRIGVVRQAADATQTGTFYLDLAYLEVGQTTVPDAWCSTFGIQNRYAPTAANEERINYIDAWGIPGDAPALIDWVFYGGFLGMANQEIIVARNSSPILASLPLGVGTSALTKSSGDGTFASGVYTEHGTPSGAVINVDFSLTAGDMSSKSFRVFVQAQSSDADATIDITKPSNASNYTFITGGAGIATASNVELIDVGMVTFRPINKTDTIQLSIDGLGASETFTFEYVYLLPVREFMIASPQSLDRFRIYGTQQEIDSDNSTSILGVLGTMWYADVGNVTNRWIILRRAKDGAQTIDDTDALTASLTTLTITPRTRHLLGTV